MLGVGVTGWQVFHLGKGVLDQNLSKTGLRDYRIDLKSLLVIALSKFLIWDVRYTPLIKCYWLVYDLFRIATYLTYMIRPGITKSPQWRKQSFSTSPCCNENVISIPLQFIPLCLLTNLFRIYFHWIPAHSCTWIHSLGRCKFHRSDMGY